MQLSVLLTQTGDAELTTLPEVELKPFKFLQLQLLTHLIAYKGVLIILLLQIFYSALTFIYVAEVNTINR